MRMQSQALEMHDRQKDISNISPSNLDQRKSPCQNSDWICKHLQLLLGENEIWGKRCQIYMLKVWSNSFASDSHNIRTTPNMLTSDCRINSTLTIMCATSHSAVQTLNQPREAKDNTTSGRRTRYTKKRMECNGEKYNRIPRAVLVPWLQRVQLAGSDSGDSSIASSSNKLLYLCT